MSFHKVLSLSAAVILLCNCHGYQFSNGQDMDRNDISSYQREGRGSDYEPSFLDEILGADYFEMEDSTDKKVNPIPITTQVPPDTDSVESEIVSEKSTICLGCPTEVVNTDPKLKEISMFAFNTYASKSSGLSDDDTAHLVRVIKASTQVVAGYKYILTVELSPSNCTRSKYQAEPKDCIVDEAKSKMICDFEVLEQSWTNTKEVLLAQCRDEEDNMTPTMPSYDDDFSDSEDMTTTQDEIILSPNDDDQRRRKRDAQQGPTGRPAPTNTYGGLRDADEDKETIDNMAKFSVQQLDVIDDDNEARMVVEVLSVKKQTVSGWLYHLKLRVAQTTCREGEEVTMEKCKNKIILPFTICNVQVLFQPWQTMQKKVTESQCVPEKMKKSKKAARKLFSDSDFNVKPKKNEIKKKRVSEGPMIGGPKIVPSDAPELLSLVDWAVERVDAQSNAMHAQKLVNIVHAERQLVSGILTKMVIETAYTTCRKGPGVDKSKCLINEAREHQFCKITIWEKPWLNEKTMTDSKCGKSDEIMKRKRRDTRNILIASTLESNDDLVEQQFGAFIQKYNKKYATPEEYRNRLAIFQENQKKIKLLQDTEAGTATYGSTFFADLTDEEFAERHLGLRPDLRQKGRGKKAKIPLVPKLPSEFDWRHYNVVTPVKQQGSCGSCWAFSVTGNIEGLYARQHNNLVSFSEQELVDCDTLDSGCGGGLPENAYKSLQKIGGLESEQAYPYDGRNEKCHFNQEAVQAKVTGFVELPKNETEIAAWLFKNGPISIGINANAMQFYFGGVSHPWKYLCSPTSLDHGVLIVGYGVHTTKYTHKIMPYWLVKNSWGPHWGEQGYYRVYRGDGTCGVNMMATSAVIA